MKKNNFCFIFICVLISIVLVGCSTQKIEFKRESAFQNTMNNISTPKKDTVTKSKNIYIYSYGDSEKTDNSNMNFGPKEVNFDPMRKF